MKTGYILSNFLLYFAISVEVVMLSQSGFDAEVYEIIAEARILLWLIVASLLYSRKLSTAAVSCLVAKAYTVWNLSARYFGPINTETLSFLVPLSVILLLSLYAAFKISRKAPKCAFSLNDLNGAGVFLLVKKVTVKSLLELFLVTIGRPVSSVAITADNAVYIYKDSRYSKLQLSQVISSKHKKWYAVPLPLNSFVVQKELDKLIGTVYDLIKANCSLTPRAVWNMLGLKPFFLDVLPGVMVWRILR